MDPDAVPASQGHGRAALPTAVSAYETAASLAAANQADAVAGSIHVEHEDGTAVDI